MANKAISELPQAQNVNNQDLFVLEQSGIAKKLPAETFITEQGIINALAEALDGHGGIQSVTLSSVSGRIRTYRITFTDQSATTFQVYDGTSIDRISRTSSSGLDDVYTIFLSDGTTTFFTVHNGADGNVSEAMLNDALKDKAPAVTETTESSAIANFPDGADDMVMHNVVAEINPVQDLTYGDPYPAGSGKNLLDVQAGISEQFSRSGETFTNTVTDTRTAFSLAVQAYNGSTLIASNSTSPSGTYPSRTYVDITISSTPTLIRIKHNGSTRDLKIDFSFTKTGTFRFSCLIQNSDPTTVGGIVLKDLMIAENNYYTPFAPYSNICPITGWTSCNVTRTGKNLVDISQFATEYPTLCSFNNDVLTCEAATQLYNTGISVWIPQGSTVNCTIDNGTATNVRIRFAYADGSVYDRTAFPFNPPKDVVGIRFNWSTAGTFTVTNFQAELGSTATAYEPYITPATASLSWQTEAGTVYGGTIDVATGLLTVDRANIVYNGSSGEVWHAYTYANLLVLYIDNNALAKKDNYVGSMFASMFRITASHGGNYDAWTMSGYVDSNNSYPNKNWIYFKMPLSVASNIEEAKAWAASNPIQIVYELATPQTYQLTPQEVKTLLGTNNVWADTGNVSVTYPADTKMFIEKLTMPTEDDMTANQAITSGKYFMIGNSLYLALANIASGAQITIGTNAQRVSLADALNTINS